jgi:hypothetical protein
MPTLQQHGQIVGNLVQLRDRDRALLCERVGELGQLGLGSTDHPGSTACLTASTNAWILDVLTAGTSTVCPSWRGPFAVSCQHEIEIRCSPSDPRRISATTRWCAPVDRTTTRRVGAAESGAAIGRVLGSGTSGRLRFTV